MQIAANIGMIYDMLKREEFTCM